MIVISLALFCRFPFINGYGENLPNFKHLFKWNLSNVCSYVTNAGLSPSPRVTAKAIEKTQQSIWFDCCCTDCTLIDIVMKMNSLNLYFKDFNRILCILPYIFNIQESYFHISQWLLLVNYKNLSSCKDWRFCWDVQKLLPKLL